MKARILWVVPLFLLAILASTALVAYNAIEQTNRAVEQTLVAGIASQTNASPELHRTLALYRAFEGKRNSQIARKAMLPMLAEVGILLLLFLFVIYGVSKPTRRLARSIESLDFSRPAEELTLREEGSQEVRSLIRSFNAMIVRLKDYETLVGDASRFRGWKEISRIIVHEVNNLISPVETYAGYLAERLEGKDAQKAAAILAKLAEIRDILYKFRSMSHLPDPVFESLELEGLARGVAAEFSRPVAVSAEGACRVSGDRTLLSEMIRNVVKNGLESSPDAAVCINLSDGDGQTVMRITDDGPGMDEQTLTRAFESGFTTKPGGLGIGLSVVRSIAAEHRAAVRIDSRPGNGVSFEFRFPRTCEEVE